MTISNCEFRIAEFRFVGVEVTRLISISGFWIFSQRLLTSSPTIRRHPLSYDFSATSLISVIVQLRATTRRDKLPQRHSECGFGVAAFGRKPPFEFPARYAALCRDAATSGWLPRSKAPEGWRTPRRFAHFRRFFPIVHVKTVLRRQHKCGLMFAVLIQRCPVHSVFVSQARQIKIRGPAARGRGRAVENF